MLRLGVQITDYDVYSGILNNMENSLKYLALGRDQVNLCKILHIEPIFYITFPEDSVTTALSSQRSALCADLPLRPYSPSRPSCQQRRPCQPVSSRASARVRASPPPCSPPPAIPLSDPSIAFTFTITINIYKTNTNTTSHFYTNLTCSRHDYI